MHRPLVLTALLACLGGCVSTPYVAGLRPPRTALPDLAHAEQRLEGVRGVELFHQSWRPQEAEPRGVLVIVHGLKDHGSRYEDLAARLVARGFAVHAADLRGHGDSAGNRVWVDDFEDYVQDLERVVGALPEADRARPLFLLGHSMGGAIVLRYAATHQERLAGLILSAAALELPVPGPVRGIGRFLGTVTPRLPLLALENAKFSRDPAMVAAMGADPLIFQPSGPARTARELFGAVSANQSRYESLRLPLLILHGEADQVTSPGGSKKLHDRAGSANKTLKLYPELFHDLLHEPERDQVMTDIAAWLEERAPAPAPSQE